MNKITFTWKMAVALAIAAVVGGVAVFAAIQQSSGAKSKMAELTLGVGNFGLNCSRASLQDAVKYRDKATFHVRHHQNGMADWEDGTKPDKLAPMDMPKDTGGALPTPAPSASAPLTGVHSTQAVEFSDTADMQAFVNALKSE